MDVFEFSEMFKNLCDSYKKCDVCEINEVVSEVGRKETCAEFALRRPQAMISVLIRWAKSQQPLPCPFCGEKPTVEQATSQSFQVVCHSHKCEIRPRTKRMSSKEDAIRAWNERVRKG